MYMPHAKRQASVLPCTNIGIQPLKVLVLKIMSFLSGPCFFREDSTTIFFKYCPLSFGLFVYNFIKHEVAIRGIYLDAPRLNFPL